MFMASLVKLSLIVVVDLLTSTLFGSYGCYVGALASRLYYRSTLLIILRFVAAIEEFC